MAPRKLKKASAGAGKRLPRVLLLTHNHPDFFPGGTEIFAHRLFTTLRDKKLAKPFFLAAHSHALGSSRVGVALSPVRGKDDEFLLHTPRFDYFFQSQPDPEPLTRDFVALLKELKPDLVHIHHTLRLGMEVIPLIRATLPKARIVYTLHDFLPMCQRDGQMVRTVSEELCDKASPSRCHECFPEHPASRFKMRELFVKHHFESVDRFLSPSAFLAGRYVEWGIPKRKMQVMKNGIVHATPAKVRPLVAGEKRGRFGFFGQISPFKGVLVLIEAARMLRAMGNVNFHVHIHGNMSLQDDTFKQRFQQALAAAENCVTWHGPYEQKHLALAMHGIDWVVVPSTWWENAPLVIDEALLHQRPVICSDVGGMAEKITDGKNGLHFKVGDAASLCAAMERATQPALWNKLHERTAPPPDIEEAADAHAALYASVLKQA